MVTALCSGVAALNVGDRVVLLFHVACGYCRNCESGLTVFCAEVNVGLREELPDTSRWAHSPAGRLSTRGCRGTILMLCAYHQAQSMTPILLC